MAQVISKHQCDIIQRHYTKNAYQCIMHVNIYYRRFCLPEVGGVYSECASACGNVKNSCLKHFTLKLFQVEGMRFRFFGVWAIKLVNPSNFTQIKTIARGEGVRKSIYIYIPNVTLSSPD